jgi:lipopolysaccharide transport system ATP-binding protein
MSAPIITVENLGKRYSLRHLRDQRYVALRDVLVEKATGLFRRKVQSAKPKANGAVPSALSPSPLSPESSDSSVSGTSKEDFWALKGVSFEVQKGEVVGIIGRNGAGKSTLLKILSRITDPTEGKVTLRGRVASLLEVGTGFHPELTGRENIYLNGAILGMSRAEIKKKFDEIVAFAETAKFLDTPVKHYSSGMYVRLAFAVAAHLEPEILIVDEVLAVGDAEFQKKCLGKMESVAKRNGRTILFVSHNLAAVCALCTRGFVIDQGEIDFNGTAGDAVAHYNANNIMRTNRARSNQPQICDVTIDQKELREGNLAIDVGFDSPWALDPLLIGIVIYASDGGPVFGFNSWMDPEFDTTPVRCGTASLLIRDLPLHPGLYRVSVWLGEKNENHDYLPNAVVFEFSVGSSLPRGLSSEIIGSTRVCGKWNVKSIEQSGSRFSCEAS